MRESLKRSLNSLHLSDIYSLMLFILFKIQEIPDYATISELCYLLDSTSMTRLLTYFAGKTVTFPTESEMAVLTNALLMYQYINIDGESITAAHQKLNSGLSKKELDEATDLYLKIIPIMKQYNIDRGQLQKTHG